MCAGTGNSRRGCGSGAGSPKLTEIGGTADPDVKLKVLRRVGRPHGTGISSARCRLVGRLGQFLRAPGCYLRSPGGGEVGDYVGARGATRRHGPQVRNAVPV